MRRIDAESETLIASTLKSNNGGGGFGSDPSETFIAHALRAEGHDASEDGTGRGVPLVPMAFQSKASASQTMNVSDVAPSMDVGKCDGLAVCSYAIQERAVSEGASGPGGMGMREEIAYTLEAREKVQAVGSRWAVRRLTPVECEKLQGFEPGFTQVEYRGKPAADGPRYRALGNSMAVPVMRFLGERILEAERTR